MSLKTKFTGSCKKKKILFLLLIKKKQILLWIIASTISKILYALPLMLILDETSLTLKGFYILFKEGETV